MLQLTLQAPPHRNIVGVRVIRSEALAVLQEGPSDTNGEAPLVVWLQGGPGGSSLFGLFVENGPLGVDANLDVYVRKTSWATKYNMLFIDSPVGAGFSFTSSDDGCANRKPVVSAWVH